MFPYSIQNSPEVDQPGFIELERFDCGATCGRQTDDERAILIPRKMIGPGFSPRIIQRRCFTRYRINTANFGVLVVVATLTRQCQIIERVLPIQAFGDDMFNGKGLIGKTQLALAIFATAARPLNHRLLLLCGDWPISQR